MIDALPLLEEMIRFPSESGKEADIADFVQAWCTDHGLPVDRIENNVIASTGSGNRTLLLNSHLDVVPASADHPHPPFEPTIVKGRLYGRGSVDAKASGASMLSALLHLHRSDWKPGGRILVALTACEEVSLPPNGLQTILPHLPEISGAVIGEPTSLQPCFSQKGMLVLKVVAYGASAHAARPTLGKNAVVQAARDVTRLDNFEFERSFDGLGKPTLAVTTIEGGTFRNVIPDRCSFYVDLRTTPSYRHEEIIQTLKDLLESDVTVHSDRYRPTATPVSSRIADAVRRALPDAEPFGSPTVSDWAFLGDIPAVKLGPGDSRLSHTSGESIDTVELQRAVEVYADVARSFFDHE